MLFIPKNYQPPLDGRYIDDAVKLIKYSFQMELAGVLSLCRLAAPLFILSDTGINDYLNGIEPVLLWWCNVFFPGGLWYLYENSNNPELLAYAKDYTSRVEQEKYTTNNHDVGFMLFCSYGNGLPGILPIAKYCVQGHNHWQPAINLRPDPFLGFQQSQVAISGHHRQYDEP